MQLVGVGRSRPRLGTYFLYRGGIQDAESIRGGGFAGPPGVHRLCAALLQRRVVEERVRPGVEDLVRQRRWLGQIAREAFDGAGLNLPQHRDQTFDIHSRGQAIFDGLVDERVVRNLAVAGNVLEAGELVGEHRGEKVLRFHALERGGDSTPAALAGEGPWRRGGSAPGGGILRPPRWRGRANAREAFQRQRMGNIGASSSAWTSRSRTVWLLR